MAGQNHAGSEILKNTIIFSPNVFIDLLSKLTANMFFNKMVSTSFSFCSSSISQNTQVLINYPQPLLCHGKKDLALTKGMVNLVCTEVNWSSEHLVGILDGLSMLVVRGDTMSEKGNISQSGQFLK